MIGRYFSVVNPRNTVGKFIVVTLHLPNLLNECTTRSVVICHILFGHQRLLILLIHNFLVASHLLGLSQNGLRVNGAVPDILKQRIAVGVQT